MEIAIVDDVFFEVVSKDKVIDIFANEFIAVMHRSNLSAEKMLEIAECLVRAVEDASKKVLAEVSCKLINHVIEDVSNIFEIPCKHYERIPKQIRVTKCYDLSEFKDSEDYLFYQLAILFLTVWGISAHGQNIYKASEIQKHLSAALADI